MCKFTTTKGIFVCYSGVYIVHFDPPPPTHLRFIFSTAHIDAILKHFTSFFMQFYLFLPSPFFIFCPVPSFLLVSPAAISPTTTMYLEKYIPLLQLLPSFVLMMAIRSFQKKNQGYLYLSTSFS